MKINVAVLFGGKSVEHEVSVISALQAMQNMNKDKYQLYPVYITKKNELYYGEYLDKIDEYKDIPKLLEKSTKINMVTDGNKTYIIPQHQKVFSSRSRLPLSMLRFPLCTAPMLRMALCRALSKLLICRLLAAMCFQAQSAWINMP